MFLPGLRIEKGHATIRATRFDFRADAELLGER